MSERIDVKVLAGIIKKWHADNYILLEEDCEYEDLAQRVADYLESDRDAKTRL